MFSILYALTAILLASLIFHAESISDGEPADDNSTGILDEGNPSQQGRVISEGQLPPELANPFQVGIKVDGEFRCSGAFAVVRGIQIVLTATQCFYEGYPQEFTLVDLNKVFIYFGLDVRTMLSNAKEAKPTQIIINEDYDPNFFTNDICIIFLDKVIPIESGHIEPIELAEHGWPLPSKITVSGWGTQFLGGTLSGIGRLREAEVSLMDIGDCQQYDTTVTGRQFCVNGGGKRRGPCSRDQGGPATARNSSNNKKYLYGIISYNAGYVCGHPSVPAVLSRISEFYFWIQNTVFYNRP